MAALSFTATDVKQVSGTFTSRKIASGVTVTSGLCVTLNTDNEVVLAAPTSANLAGGGTTNKGLYIALSGGSAGQTITLARIDSIIDYGAVTIRGKVFYVDAAGALNDDIASVTSGEFVSIIGYGDENNDLVLKPTITGISIS